jgi:hypothetical protein
MSILGGYSLFFFWADAHGGRVLFTFTVDVLFVVDVTLEGSDLGVVILRMVGFFMGESNEGESNVKTSACGTTGRTCSLVSCVISSKPCSSALIFSSCSK